MAARGGWGQRAGSQAVVGDPQKGRRERGVPSTLEGVGERPPARGLVRCLGLPSAWVPVCSLKSASGSWQEGMFWLQTGGPAWDPAQDHQPGNWGLAVCHGQGGSF